MNGSVVEAGWSRALGIEVNKIEAKNGLNLLSS